MLIFFSLCTFQVKHKKRVQYGLPRPSLEHSLIMNTNPPRLVVLLTFLKISIVAPLLQSRHAEDSAQTCLI